MAVVALVLSIVGLATNAWCAWRWWQMRRRLEAEHAHYRERRLAFDEALGILAGDVEP